jgi:hypothetical protein
LLRSMAIAWPTWSESARRVSGSGLAAGLLPTGAVRPRADRRVGLDRVERMLAPGDPRPPAFELEIDGGREVPSAGGSPSR